MKYICVVTKNIQFNRRDGVTPDLQRPVFYIRIGDQQFVAREVEIHGPSTVVYRPDCPMAGSDATAWIETSGPITIEQDGKSVRIE